MKTVGELKTFIKDLPDETKLVKRSDNRELRNAYINEVYCTVEKMNAEKEKFYDHFDYTSYEKEVYNRNKEGEDVIIIL